MRDTAFPWHILSEPRIAMHAAALRAAWVWSNDGRRLIWANPAGAAAFGASTSAAIAGRAFPPDHPAARQIARIAASLPVSGAARLDRLHGFGGGLGHISTCLCMRLPHDGGPIILVTAVEASGPELTLAERAQRLFAGIDEPLAAYSTRGDKLFATPDASARLATMPSSGIADLLERGGRIGDGDDEMLLLRWPQSAAATSGIATNNMATREMATREGAATIAADSIDLAPIAEAIGKAQKAFTASATHPSQHAHGDHASGSDPSPAEAERRHPLRFVWKIGPDHRFSIEPGDFLDLIGPGIAGELDRPWISIASDLGLDPHGAVARAIASHDTWSGVHVAWPLDGSEERIAVELAGLPVYDRDRSYRGYRGFGVCRDLDHIAALKAQRARQKQNAAADETAAPAETAMPAARPALSVVPAVANVVPFRPSSNDNAANGREPQKLDPQEHDAFAELASRLSARLKDGSETAKPDIVTQESASRAPSSAPATALAILGELETILDIATDGVVTLDRDGRIVSASPGAARLFGYDDDQLAGLLFTNLFATDSEFLAHMILAEQGSIHPGRKHDMTGRTRRGKTMPLAMSFAPLHTTPAIFCAAFQNLSGWRAAERELTEARRRAEAASAAKSDFLAKVSHEIRTPLNAIIGFSELMIDQRFGPIGNERYGEYLKDIQASGTHIASLVNDLLDLSKIEAGKLDLTFEPVNLNDLTQQSVALMAPQANRGRIIIRTSLASELPPVVADARSVRQIMLNLLSNSIKFTGAGGQVILSTARGDHGEAVLRVRDTGIGMSGADIATALEPFRQLSAPSQTDSTGTGLGLPLTKALAEANSARFSIKSERNAGTLVEIVFPPVRAAE